MLFKFQQYTCMNLYKMYDIKFHTDDIKFHTDDIQFHTNIYNIILYFYITQFN